MKTIYILLFAMLFLLSCSDSKVRGLEELPKIHIAIYKTNADYIDFVNIWGTDHDHASNVLIADRLNFENGDTALLFRWKLEQGYVVDCAEIGHTDYFSNVSFKEIFRYNELHKAPFPFDSIEARIIDKDPFIEFYVENEGLFYKMPEQIDEINEIIRNGEIEKYFHRLK